ncbi:hypothetical protein BDN67DRAFT_526396 [Paxillus ammoniavirescens]|nr:hypothetical protein BDN67DRAFT_526396 [Paxillus ammoniavirescens]
MSLHDSVQRSRVSAGWACVIRPDSYTDKATGVTHIYNRQLVGGIEVADAHVDLNGKVLNFGDSVPCTLALSLHLVFPPRPPPLTFVSHRLIGPCKGQRGSRHPPFPLLYLCKCPPAFGSSNQVDLDMDPKRPLLTFLASTLPENDPSSAPSWPTPRNMAARWSRPVTIRHQE